MKKIGFVVFAVLVVGFIVFAMMYQSGTIGSGEKTPPGEKMVAKSKSQHERNWQTVANSEVPIYYSAVGTVRSREEINLISRLPAARVLQVNVDSGEAFAEDEVLVRLEDSDLQAQVNAAQENLHAAESRLQFARTDYERNRGLFDSQTIARRQFEESESIFNAAQAQVAMLQHELNNAQVALAFSVIKAPFAGIVSERQADPGDLATPQNTLLKVFNPAKLQLRVPIRESLFSRIKLDDQLQVAVESTGRIYAAEVREIVPSVDPGSRTFLINACFAGDTTGLNPGMFATCRIPVDVRQALTVPVNAITKVGQLEYLTVPNQDDEPELRLVKTIPVPDSGLREIISGAYAGLKYLL
jgi:RND family efflux transporter MFP subunit